MRIAVLGAGHMGRWLTSILRGRHPVAVYDREADRLRDLDGVTILSGYEDLKNFIPDLLLNAVSIRNTLPAFQAAAPFLKRDCILSDVTSVKGGLAGYYRECGLRFVSMHPMFGPTFANVERLEDENVILIRESDEAGADFFRKTFIRLGLNIHEVSFERHDRMIAYSLTLPFASTLVFASCLDPGAVPGTTFRKHRDIARGLLAEDDDLLAEILFNPQSLEQLERVTGRLEFLKHVIMGRDMDEARRFLAGLRRNIDASE